MAPFHYLSSRNVFAIVLIFMFICVILENTRELVSSRSVVIELGGTTKLTCSIGSYVLSEKNPFDESYLRWYYNGQLISPQASDDDISTESSNMEISWLLDYAIKMGNVTIGSNAVIDARAAAINTSNDKNWYFIPMAVRWLYSMLKYKIVDHHRIYSQLTIRNVRYEHGGIYTCTLRGSSNYIPPAKFRRDIRLFITIGYVKKERNFTQNESISTIADGGNMSRNELKDNLQKRLYETEKLYVGENDEPYYPPSIAFHVPILGVIVCGITIITVAAGFACLFSIFYILHNNWLIRERQRRQLEG
ncbi:hypothetical protein SNEBB_007469 [Seison nebaliae]|nr:hypothetical protein SNEBB_007469 [Seison nebaliae]